MKKEYTFEELIEKANRCILCAMKCSTKWGEKFWMDKAQQLKDKAFELPINK